MLVLHHMRMRARAHAHTHTCTHAPTHTPNPIPTDVLLQAGAAPNGTGFMITRASEPFLDEINLIVGRVTEGMDVVETIASQPYSKPRESAYDAPFFQVRA